MFALVLVASIIAADVDAGTHLAVPAQASASTLYTRGGTERLRVASSECDDASDVGRTLSFDGEGYVCTPTQDAEGAPIRYFWQQKPPPPVVHAASTTTPDDPFRTTLIWALAAMVLAFGFGAGASWLHASATRERATNPALADAMDALGDELVKLKGAAGPDPSSVLGPVLESFFHAHTVATGAPHPADPRAP